MKLLPPTLSVQYSLEGVTIVTMHIPSLRCGELCPTPWGGMYTHYLIFFRFGDLSPPPIYLCHHLFRSVWTCEYLLYTLGCIQYCVTLWLKLIQFWPSGAVSVAPMSFCGIPPPPLCPVNVITTTLQKPSPPSLWGFFCFVLFVFVFCFLNMCLLFLAL